MTTRKSGLLGLILGMAFLAACEPKSEVIVEPAPTDTTPTINLNLVPETATLNVNGTVTLVPVVTGTTDQRVTFTSSNSSIASVDANGVVTGRAIGQAVITAVSTADPRARDASTIQVVAAPVQPPAQAPTISIQSITQGGTQFPVNTNNVAGQIDVTVNADIPSGSNVQRLDVVLINASGAERQVCTQPFTGTGEISINSQIPVEIVCSINTAEFNPATGEPVSPNGTYQVRARLVGPTGQPVATATSQPLVFNNVNFVMTSAIETSFFRPGETVARQCVNAGTDPRSIAGAGSRWCGGDLVLRLTPVIFGTAGGNIANDRLASVSVTLTTSGVGVNGMTNCDGPGTTGTVFDGAVAPEDQQRVYGTSVGLTNDGQSPLAGTASGRNNVGFTSMGLTITDLDGDGAQDQPGCPSIQVVGQDTNGADGFSVTFSAQNDPDCVLNQSCVGGTGAGLSSNGIRHIEDRIMIQVNSTTVGGQIGPVCINPDPRNNPLPSTNPNIVGGCGLGTGGVPVGGGPFVPGSPANVAFLGNGGFFLNLDNLGPRIIEFDLQPAGCFTAGTVGGCYVNGNFPFQPRAGFFQSVDYGSDSQNANTTFRVGTSLTSLTAVTAGAQIPNTVTANDLFIRAEAIDGLGNTSGARGPASCAAGGDPLGAGTPPCFAGATTNSTTAGNNLRFGIDTQTPEFDLNASVLMPNNGANDGLTFQFAYRDAGVGPSGFPIVTYNTALLPASVPFTGPVWVRVEYTNADGTFCLNPDPAQNGLGAGIFTVAGGGNSGCAGGPEGNGFVPTDGNFTINGGGAFTQGYYRVRFFLMDAAGNRTGEAQILTLIDTSAPTVGAISTPSIITGNASADFRADAIDNLDLGDAQLYTTYTGAGFVRHLQEGLTATPIPGATYGPPLNTTGTAVVTVPNFIRSLEEGIGGPIHRAGSVSLLVRDQAGVVDGDLCPNVDAADNATTVATIPNRPVGGGAVGNCRKRTENIATAVAAGIPGGTSASRERSLSFTGIVSWTLNHNARDNAGTALPLCNATTQSPAEANAPCPTGNPRTATISATATGPSATFANPFVRVNFYYRDINTFREVLFATSTSPTVTDFCPAGNACPPTPTNRSFTWTAPFTPNAFDPGVYRISVVGVHSTGMGLIDSINLTVAVD